MRRGSNVGSVFCDIINLFPALPLSANWMVQFGCLSHGYKETASVPGNADRQCLAGYYPFILWVFFLVLGIL